MPTLALAIATLVPAFTLSSVIATAQTSSSNSQDALVQRALLNEISAAKDSSHPMRYRLRKTSPNLTTIKNIIETHDGDVARLISRDNAPLSAADEQIEQDRLNQLLNDPSRQRHRQQGEDSDLRRAMKILQVLPDAFLYQYSRTDGNTAKFAFHPNPNFQSEDLETRALTAMDGELWVDTTAERVTRLEGHLKQDVDYGWGILGQLNKGGYILIEQAEVAPKIWHTTNLKLKMSFRILYKSKASDATLELTDFSLVPQGLDYKQAIQMLRAQ
jgi:hypothetical protein